jgi:hypothetical protein
MRKLIASTGAILIGFALATATAFAQNMHGPGAPNFGLTDPQTGGAVITAPNTGAAAGEHPLYNFAPRESDGHAKHKSKHATGGSGR